MTINVPGLIAIIAFYLLILFVGMFAAWQTRKRPKTESKADTAMVAGRDIGVLVGIFTMTATWVGGGFINGTAEVVYNPGQGLIWCQAPVGYALSLFIGGIFFAGKMRKAGYVTMLDPFQEKYGSNMGALLFIPALMGEIFWSAAILSALGASLTVIAGLAKTPSIIISACIAVGYTLVGGMFSVAYTDVVQLICIFVGLWISIPFALTNTHVSSIASTKTRWLGKLDPMDGANWADNALMLIFGGIPWQVYFQRVLSARDAFTARTLSFTAALGCIVMSIPSVLIGAIGASTNWTAVDSSAFPGAQLTSEQMPTVLPLVLQHLCPVWVAFVGVGAVSAAVMSSADSSILAAASMFARNILGLAVWRGRASPRRLVWVMRVSVPLAGAAAAAMGITVDTIYGLWAVCSDLVYVVLFPQLICVLYLRHANTYGSLLGYFVSLFLRLTAGESLVKLPTLFKYTAYVDGDGYYQRFPVKTLAMLSGLVIIVLVSFITDVMFRSGCLSAKFDIFKCFDYVTISKRKAVVGADNPGYTLDKNDMFEDANAEKIPRLIHYGPHISTV